MSTAIKIDKISSVSIHAESPKPRSRISLRNLPNRLDAATCLEILCSVDPELTPAKIAASGKPLEIDLIDDLLEYTDFDLQSRMHFKSACAEFGIIARGVRRSPSTWGA